MTKAVILPENQMVMLNRYLIDNADRLPSPVITVGGQAVMYWYATYMDFYPEQPDMTFITSMLQTLPFRDARKYVDYFASIIWRREFRRFQVEQGIPLYVILAQLVEELTVSPGEFVLPEFYRNELPRKVASFKKEYMRYQKLVADAVERKPIGYREPL